ncbi:MAG: Two-component sensor histidine kinase [Ferruginibacter sp.]|nr:Two-component sensor histidine kinase [Ferruginibacter sp.]
MPFSSYKSKRIRFIFIVYWFLLSYIIAALVWWFIALNQQNRQMATFERSQLNPSDKNYTSRLHEIADVEKRKTAQYIGEGSIFLLLILSGAAFIYKAVKRQFKSGQQQQNFMMAVTHELKTPIAIAKLNLETLLKRKLDDSQQQRLIQNTIQEANRLNALCNNMLLASQMEAGAHSITKEEISLSVVTSDCVNDFIMRYPQRVFIRSITEDIYINGDMLMLQMAINNLIDNAIKYSPKESAITITLSQQESGITLMVKDEGKGIDTMERKKVFDKFYRIGNAATKGAKGTGLGLFLTKKILAQHGADIFVTDNTPTGSNFVIVFKEKG